MNEIQKLLAAGPLYQASVVQVADLWALLRHFYARSLRFDTYCPLCKDSTTWQLSYPPFPNDYDGSGPMGVPLFETLKGLLLSMEFRCSRHPTHTARACIHAVALDPNKSGGVITATLTKFGQLPSVADLATSELDQYQKFISKEDLVELKRAVGLAAHGVGIGSFVYLRRIFERLVSEAAARARAHGAAGLERFETLRMEEKLQCLAGYVPPWMVENRKLYGVLSAGLHELTDQTCLNAFPAVKLATIALLEQHAEQARREARAKEAAEQLARVQSVIATPKQEG
jgi:hypothetical protein